MGIAVCWRIDQTQNSLKPWPGQAIVLPILGTQVNRTLARQPALVENIIEFSAIVLVKKYVVPNQRKSGGLGVHGEGKGRERTLRRTR